MTCVFCEPEPELVIHRALSWYALWSKFEVAPGHALLVPRAHVASWWEVATDTQRNMMSGLELVRELVERRFGVPDGYNFGANVGEAAGQTVAHAHLHLIPRRRGDVPDPRGGVRNVIPHKGNYLAAQEVASLDRTDHPLYEVRSYGVPVWYGLQQAAATLGGMGRRAAVGTQVCDAPGAAPRLMTKDERDELLALASELTVHAEPHR